MPLRLKKERGDSLLETKPDFVPLDAKVYASKGRFVSRTRI